jgi:hypothetical protein
MALGEFEDKLNTVLSSPQAMEQIMALARALGGEGQGGAAQGPSPSSVAPQGAAPSSTGGFNPASLLGDLDPKMLSAIARIASEYSHGTDEKAALLMALRPFMKEARAAKIDRALQISRLAHIAKIAFESFTKGDTDV